MVAGGRLPPRLALRVAVAVVLLAAPAAIATGGADGANATVSMTTLSPAQTCLLVNSVTTSMCEIQFVCARCVRTAGCAYDVVARECVALPADGRALYASSSNALLNRTDLHYCSDTDKRCASCVVTTSNPFCVGDDGSCVCPSLCAALRATQLSCYAIRQSSMVYVSLAAMAIALPAIVWLHRIFTRGRRGGGGGGDGNDIRGELRRLELAQRRQHQQGRSALALQLEAWWTHRDEHKVEVDKVEPLKSCYVLMETEGGTAATTTSSEDSIRAAVQDDASTPREGDPRRLESGVTSERAGTPSPRRSRTRPNAAPEPVDTLHVARP